MSINLTEYAEAIDIAWQEGTACVLATCSADRMPDLGPKGSMMVFDKDHLAYWERSRGQSLANLREAPGAAVLYLNRERRKFLRFYGEATLHDDGDIRDQVMARTPEPELNFDPERKGVAVLIRVDRVTDPFGGGGQQRE